MALCYHLVITQTCYHRPVIITSVPSKILENMQKYLDSNVILYHHQVGFRQMQSAMEQLVVVYEDVATCVDNGGVNDVILLDYSKAFGVVCPQIILKSYTVLRLSASEVD